MGLSARDLYALGLNTDSIVGFEAQVALRKWSVSAVWPKHFVGRRVQDFEFGSSVARDYLMERAAVGRARRISRAREARETGGMMTVLRADTAGELRDEQLEAVRAIVGRHRKVEAEIAAERAEGPSAAGP